MFGFLLRRKRDAVRTLLAGQMNRFFLRQVHEDHRSAKRGMFCRVVWLIPYDRQSDEPRFDQAYPVVTRDICSEGVGMVTTRPIEQERVLVAIEGDVSLQFMICRVQHCTPLGYGFYQVGVNPREVVDVLPASVRTLQQRQRQFTSEPASAAS